jgi:hypothetical protein
MLLLTKIDGVKYNTRELQRANFSNIQVKGNSLYGIPIQQNYPIQESKNIKPLVPTTHKFSPESRISTEAYIKQAPGTGIILTGKVTPEQQKIVSKYSPFFKAPITVNMVTDYSLKNDKDTITRGKTYFDAADNRKIEVSEEWVKDGKDFEYVILHEIGHYVFAYDEASADDYAKRMINLYK